MSLHSPDTLVGLSPERIPHIPRMILVEIETNLTNIQMRPARPARAITMPRSRFTALPPQRLHSCSGSRARDSQKETPGPNNSVLPPGDVSILSYAKWEGTDQKKRQPEGCLLRLPEAEI